MLEIRDLHVYYGEIHALKGISLQVAQGEIVALAREQRRGEDHDAEDRSRVSCAPGRVRCSWKGESIHGLPPHEIVARGVAHSPEGRKVFNRLTVTENLEMGAYLRSDAAVQEDLDRVFTLFPRLKERRLQVAGTLSGGEQQMLAIGRALMARPRILLLDEPSMGLAPLLVEQIFETVAEVNRQGTTILLVEQNAAIALSVAHRAYVLETGSIALEGGAAELSEHPEVQRAYLGEAV